MQVLKVQRVSNIEQQASKKKTNNLFFWPKEMQNVEHACIEQLQGHHHHVYLLFCQTLILKIAMSVEKCTEKSSIGSMQILHVISMILLFFVLCKNDFAK